MQLTAPCTLIPKAHRAADLHVCTIVKMILHEIHTLWVLCLLGRRTFWVRVNRNAFVLYYLIVPIRENDRLNHTLT